MNSGRARLQGEVVEILPNAAFRIRLEDGHLVTAHVAETMRGHYVRLLAGDRVEVEVTTYDTTRARIVARAGEGMEGKAGRDFRDDARGREK